MCFDFVVPACQDFDCSLPTLPSLAICASLNRVMGGLDALHGGLWMGCGDCSLWKQYSETSIQGGHPRD